MIDATQDADAAAATLLDHLIEDGVMDWAPAPVLAAD
jgi:hypothetical protein